MLENRTDKPSSLFDPIAVSSTKIIVNLYVLTEVLGVHSATFCSKSYIFKLHKEQLLNLLT